MRGTGDRAVLGHVPDEHDCDPLPFRQLHQPQRGLANLAHAPGGAIELLDGHRLDRVDDDERRPARTSRLHDRPDLARGENRHGIRGRSRAEPESAGAKPHLPG